MFGFTVFCIEVGVSPPNTKVVMAKTTQPDERIRYNRDTLISIQSSAYALTTPKCVADAIESGNRIRWLRPHEIHEAVVGDNKRKSNTNKDSIRPLVQTNNILPPVRRRTSDEDVVPQQSPTIDKSLQNQRQLDDDPPLIVEKADRNTLRSGMT